MEAEMIAYRQRIATLRKELNDLELDLAQAAPQGGTAMVNQGLAWSRNEKLRRCNVISVMISDMERAWASIKGLAIANPNESIPQGG